MSEIKNQDLEQVSGGVVMSAKDSLYDLTHYVYKTVVNVPDGYYLQLRRSPNGEIVPDVGWTNGSKIVVYRDYKPNGWYLAYHETTGIYGYVCPVNVI